MIQEQKPPSAPSPCINVCILDAENGLCHGSFRTLAEISIWSQASNEEKWSILLAVTRRREVLGQ